MEEIIAKIDNEREYHILHLEEVSRHSRANLTKIRHEILEQKQKSKVLKENCIRTKARKKETPTKQNDKNPHTIKIFKEVNELSVEISIPKTYHE